MVETVYEVQIAFLEDIMAKTEAIREDMEFYVATFKMDKEDEAAMLEMIELLK